MTDLQNRQRERAIAAGDTDHMRRQLLALLAGRTRWDPWPERTEDRHTVRKLRVALGLCERCGFGVSDSERYLYYPGPDGERAERAIVLCPTCSIDFREERCGFYGAVTVGTRMGSSKHWRTGSTQCSFLGGAF